MENEVIARAEKRAEWAARALQATAEDLRDAQPIGAELAAESERAAGLVEGIAALRSVERPSRQRAWGK